MPLQPFEIEIDVDMLCLESTSFRQLVEANDRDLTGSRTGSSRSSPTAGRCTTR
jgi:hypothetical protein